MDVFQQYQKVRPKLKSIQPIGFVPTMGALHNGHLSLVKKALTENAHVVVSIFVNPTQFDDPHDLDKYPRPLATDLQLLKAFGNKISVYTPSVLDVYGASPVMNTYDFGSLAATMEGVSRKNHFNGVATVVEKLLRLLTPDTAYFGEKDFQQLQIIRRLVQQKKIPIAIVGVPIVREENGLAMSSRNQLLHPSQRSAASVIYETLLMVRSQFKKTSLKETYSKVTKIFEKNEHFKLDYFTIADEESLLEPNEILNDRNYRAFMAVKVGRIRLIDNIKL